MSTFSRQGVHVYIDRETLGHHKVFYSRRHCGPLYRWSYEEKAGRWLFARLHPRLTPGSLRSARKGVPQELRSALLDHYQDF